MTSPLDRSSDRPGRDRAGFWPLAAMLARSDTSSGGAAHRGFGPHAATMLLQQGGANGILGEGAVSRVGEAAQAAAAAEKAEPQNRFVAFFQELANAVVNGQVADAMARSAIPGRGPAAALSRSMFGALGDATLGMRSGPWWAPPGAAGGGYSSSSRREEEEPIAWGEADMHRPYTMEWREAQHRKRHPGYLNPSAFAADLQRSPTRERYNIEYYGQVGDYFDARVKAAVADARRRGVANPYALPEVQLLEAHRDGASRKVQENAAALNRHLAEQDARLRGGR